MLISLAQELHYTKANIHFAALEENFVVYKRDLLAKLKDLTDRMLSEFEGTGKREHKVPNWLLGLVGLENAKIKHAN